MELQGVSYKKESIDELAAFFEQAQKVIKTKNGVLVLETRDTCSAMNTIIDSLDKTAVFEAGLFHAEKKSVKRKTLITPKICYSTEIESVELHNRKKIFYVKKEIRETKNGEKKLAQIFKFNNENIILIKEKKKNQIRMNVGELTILYFPGFDINSVVIKESTVSESKSKIIDKEIHLDKASGVYYYFIE